MTNAAPATTPPAPATGAPAPEATPQQPATPAPTPTPTPTPPAPAEDTTDWKAEAEKFKKEAENARVAAKAKVANDAKRDQLLAVAEALGIDIPKGEEVTVDSLQAQLTEEANKRTGTEAALTAERQARAIDHAAWTNQIAPDKAAYLNFLLKGNDAFTSLNPSDATYQSSVAELVKTITAADPYFAATPGGATRSGNEGFGGAGTPGEVTPEAFAAMSVMDRTKLFQTNPELFKRLSAGTSS